MLILVANVPLGPAEIGERSSQGALSLIHDRTAQEFLERADGRTGLMCTLSRRLGRRATKVGPPFIRLPIRQTCSCENGNYHRNKHRANHGKGSHRGTGAYHYHQNRGRDTGRMTPTFVAKRASRPTFCGTPAHPSWQKGAASHSDPPNLYDNVQECYWLLLVSLDWPSSRASLYRRNVRPASTAGSRRATPCPPLLMSTGSTRGGTHQADTDHDREPWCPWRDDR